MKLNQLPQVIEQDLDAIAKRLEALAPSLLNQSILILGASGFFGKWLSLALGVANVRYRLNLKICLLGREAATLKTLSQRVSGSSFEDRDIFDIASMPRFDHVIHAATPASDRLNREQPEKMFHIALTGSQKVIDWAVEAKVKNLLFTSSGAVYGSQPETLTHLPETYLGGPNICDPLSAYGEAKRAAELYGRLKTLSTETKFLTARCFAFAGPWLPLDANFAIGNFNLNASKRESFLIRGDGTSRRSYMYTEDLVVWLLTILLKGENHAAYNVGSEDSISILDLAKRVKRTWGSESEIVVAGSPGGKLQQYVPSTKLAQEKLGLKMMVDLEETLHRMRRWLSPEKLGSNPL